MNKKIKGLLFILVLGSVSVALLLGIRSYTLPKIERYQEVQLKSTILQAAGIYCDEDKLDELFREKIRERKAGEFVYYLSPDNRYIFEFEGRGLWGMIEGVITLNKDLVTIESMRIIFQEETPGLGGRISEEGFQGQFQKKRADPALLLVSRKKASAADEIDAITGATMTSRALIDMINEHILKFREIMGQDAHK